MKKTIALFSLLLFFAIDTYAKDLFKRYPVKSGMILYDINTTGIAPGLTTHTIGVSRLVFDDWGAKELKEDDATEIQSGDFNEETARHTMSRMDYGTIYTVDFDENVTYQTRDRNIDIAIAQGADMSDESLEILKEMKAIKEGTEVVAGYTCDVWKTKDQTICIYQGIPLKITIEAPGFSSTRTAQMVVLDKPISDTEFALPGFAIMVDDGYTSNQSASVNTADYMAAVDDLQQKVKAMGIDLNEDNITLTKEQEAVVINTLGERYLKKQKKLLPKLMVALKGARECMNHSENGKEASSCIKAVNRINEELGDQTSNYDYSHWNREKRELIVKDIDQEISDLNLTIDCVKKHDLTTEVIECTEGTLEPKI
jgi:hypothetical protein